MRCPGGRRTGLGRSRAPRRGRDGAVRLAAHNAGEDLALARRAARSDAIVEIDVAVVGGRLVAAHDRPLPLVGRLLFRGLTLEAVWRETAGVTER